MLALTLLCQRQPLDSEIVALCAAAGEDYLFGIGPDEFSHLISSSIDRLPGNIAPVVERGRIAENVAQEGQHRLTDLREKRSCSRVIQIYSSHHLLTFNNIPTTGAVSYNFKFLAHENQSSWKSQVDM